MQPPLYERNKKACSLEKRYFCFLCPAQDVSKHYSKVAAPSQTHYGAPRSRSSAYGATTSPVELDALSPPHAAVSRYATVDDVVSYSQCQRLVQKSLVTNNLKAKCAQKTFDDAATKKS